MRLLGVDYGFKRIGLAVTDSTIGLPAARPPAASLGSLKKDAAQIASLVKREAADAVVLGLPVEAEGEGRMARLCRTLAGHLTEDHGVEVYLVDESLTSVAAEDLLFSTGMKASQRKKLRDGEAAALILERYLNEAQPS
ncbi:MAG: Holliday junction resolvase RuvX [Fimbriimonas sp.]